MPLIKSIINIRDVSNNFPTSILIDSKNESDLTKIAEGFNNHYASVAKKLQDKIHSNNTNFTRYLSDRVDSNFLFRSADTEEIIRIISSFVNSKASGPNSIPTTLLCRVIHLFSHLVDTLLLMACCFLLIEY